MQEWLVGLAVGTLVSFLAARIVGWWRSNKADVSDRALSLDDWIERKFSIDLPDRWQSWYHAQVAGAVAYVDATFGDAKSTRQLLRKIVALADPVKRGALLGEIERLVEVWREGWAKHIDSAGPELREVVNEAKEEIAVRIVGSRVSAAKSVVPGVPDNTKVPAEPEIRESIRAAAPGAIADHPSEPVTPKTLEQLILESKARQAKLAAK